MAVSLKHNFVSAKVDSVDATLVQPSNWNAEHTLTLATSSILGRSSAGTGVAQEIPVGTGVFTALGISIGSAGAFVTNTSPTFSGNVTLSSGVANGVLYLNGSLVATSGSALTFDGTNLATTGTSSATKLIPTGGGATGNGMYLPAANALAWSNNGVETMRLDASGNLGLGVTPSAWSGFKALELNDGYYAASANGPYIGRNSYWNGSNWIYKATSNATQYLQVSGAHLWNIAPSGTAGNAITFTQAMTLEASGNLLVGTTNSYRSGRLVVKDVNRTQTSSLANLHVSTTDSQAADLGGSIGLGGQIGGDETPFGYISGRKENSTSGNYAGYLAFATQNSAAAVAERMRLDSSGNLGIGQSANLTTLDIRQNTTYVLGLNTATRNYSFRIDSGASDALVLGSRTTSTDMLWLTTSGNLGIGVTSPGAKLDVQGASTRLLSGSATALAFYDLGTNAARARFGVAGATNDFMTGSAQNDALLFTIGSNAIRFGIAQVEKMVLDSSGNLVVGTAALATTATAGFPWIPSCPGIPTGAPTAPYTNAAAMVVDTTNNRLYVRVGSTWRFVTLT